MCTLLQALDGDLTRLYSDKALPLKVENVLLLQLLHLDQLLLESQLFAAQLLLLKRKHTVETCYTVTEIGGGGGEEELTEWQDGMGGTQETLICFYRLSNFVFR